MAELLIGPTDGLKPEHGFTELRRTSTAMHSHLKEV
jgi:hypothetical protein